MKVLVLHAYSALNAGDGLLVEATLDILIEAFGPETKISVAASHPETFCRTRLDEVYCSTPGMHGYDRSYIRLLADLSRFSLVVAVGGGYLRAGGVKEAVKTLLVHVPQLLFSSRTVTPSVYLSQSIGPFLPGLREPVRKLLKKIDQVYVRDDKSRAELAIPNSTRMPDVALLHLGIPDFSRQITETVPVISVREVRGRIPPLVLELCVMVGDFDGYVQSETAGNNDIEAVHATHPRRTLSREQFLAGGDSRIVVAVRLHAALMAIRAGHYVVHLAYERKGFGAFADLGLSEFVHNVNRFEPARVLAQVNQLASDNALRMEYASRVDRAFGDAGRRRTELISRLREVGMPEESRSWANQTGSE